MMSTAFWTSGSDLKSLAITWSAASPCEVGSGQEAGRMGGAKAAGSGQQQLALLGRSFYLPSIPALIIACARIETLADLCRHVPIDCAVKLCNDFATVTWCQQAAPYSSKQAGRMQSLPQGLGQ